MTTLAEHRSAIAASTYLDEDRAVRALVAQCSLTVAQRQRIMADARELVQGCRARPGDRSLLDLFLQEFGLSNQEGIALMCLAEALLRIPDEATAEDLIADKLASGNWTEHAGRSDSLFVNASTWALMLTGSVISLSDGITHDAAGWLRGLVGRISEGVVRAAMVQAMRILGDEFVLGRDIEEALGRRSGLASFDMLGEGARTAADAERYQAAYLHAVDAVAAIGAGIDPETSSGLSVKLSALHPRFESAKRETALDEITPKLKALSVRAAAAGLHLTIDAEEAHRLELTLDVFERLARDPDLEGWRGLGIAVQAYAKRAPAVIDWLVALAGATQRRFMVRLVKGAYWDTEIKRAQVLGLADYPVYTRKASTDLAYLVCAEKLARAGDRIFPCFATHNAHTVAAVATIAEGIDYEFQRLHGMGELLYDEARRRHPHLPAPRTYAPVGAHQDLLAYLVRRLLENGANSSFVNRFLDADVAVTEVVRDPQADVTHRRTARHPKIPLPVDLYGPSRANSRGIDLAQSADAESLYDAMEAFHSMRFAAAPLLAAGAVDGPARPIVNPANHGDVVGEAVEALPEHVASTVAAASRAQPGWDAVPPRERAARLRDAAERIERDRPRLTALIVREAGKTVADAVAEVREAVDFCRYYAAGCETGFAPVPLPGPTGEANHLALHGRGVFACISPWNFPLAIFTGQVTAALAAGNAVIAKPAEQTPLIACAVTRLLHEAGIPAGALQLLPGGGDVGAALVAHPGVQGVAFTGSTEVARAINLSLARRTGPIATLIAETGGQNAMVVDSSALLEQVVDDVLTSAFGAAGQRCSALRVLYVQAEIADALLEMLCGAAACLEVGDPWHLATDVGPIIDREAAERLDAHARALAGRSRFHARLSADCDKGTYVAPQIFEIDSIGDLDAEHFGPLLHVARFDAARRAAVVEEIAATGFGLTFGMQSRIGRNIEEPASQIRAGNVYVNRNMIGATVGVQPFGGEGLSGTGPKAGGPHYLPRFATERVVTVNTAATGGNAELLRLEP